MQNLSSLVPTTLQGKIGSFKASVSSGLQQVESYNAAASQAMSGGYKGADNSEMLFGLASSSCLQSVASSANALGEIKGHLFDKERVISSLTVEGFKDTQQMFEVCNKIDANMLNLVLAANTATMLKSGMLEALGNLDPESSQAQKMQSKLQKLQDNTRDEMQKKEQEEFLKKARQKQVKEQEKYNNMYSDYGQIWNTMKELESFHDESVAKFDNLKNFADQQQLVARNSSYQHLKEPRSGVHRDFSGLSVDQSSQSQGVNQQLSLSKVSPSKTIGLA